MCEFLRRVLVRWQLCRECVPVRLLQQLSCYHKGTREESREPPENKRQGLRINKQLIVGLRINKQLIVGEPMAGNEVTTVPDQLKFPEREKAAKEENSAAFPALKPDQMKEDTEDRPASKNQPGRVQSVFCLVRNQIRGQPGHEASRTGMLQLVQQVTRQLDRTKVEQGGFEDTSPRKEAHETLEIQEQETVDMENDRTGEDSQKDECVVLLQQILNSIEGLRKEVSEELNLLRQESQINTDKVLQKLTSANANTSVSVPPLSGAPKRRILRRTLTTMAPKSSTAPAFRPRCMSEPVGGRNAETTSTGSGTSPMSSLLPSLVVTQHAKKSVHYKPRVNKLAS